MEQRFEQELLAGILAVENAGCAFPIEHVPDIGPAEFSDDGAKPAEDEGDAEGGGQEMVPVEEALRTGDATPAWGWP